MSVMYQSQKTEELQKKKKKVVEKLSEVRIEKWPSVLKVMYDLDKSTSRGVVGMKA